MSTPSLRRGGLTRGFVVDLPAVEAEVSPELPPAPAWVRVRVHGPTGALDVTLPTDRTVADLVGELVGSLLPGAPVPGDGRPWRLHRLGRPALGPGARFGEADPRDGDAFHLTAAEAPVPARPALDALDALGGAGERSARWTPGRVAAAAGTATVPACAGLALLLLRIRPDSASLPLLLAAALLAGALLLRRGTAGGPDAGGVVAAAGSLPAWACAGAALARQLGGGSLLTLELAALGVAVGAVLAVAVAPHALAAWVLTGSSAGVLAVGAAVVTTGLLDGPRAAAVLGTAVLLATTVLPVALTRARTWTSPSPAEGDPAALARWGRRTRALLTAASVSGAAAVATCAVVLVLSPDGLRVWLGVALAVLLALRARRSRFVAASGTALAAAALPLTVVLVATALRVGPAGRWAVALLLGAAVVGLLALVATARRAAAGEDVALEGVERARVRRVLDGLEAVVAVSVVPLLAGALGLYAAAVEAGSRM